MDEDTHQNKKRKTETGCVPIVLDTETPNGPVVKSDFLLHLPVAAQIKYQRLDKYFIGCTAEEVFNNRYKVQNFLLEPVDKILWEILFGYIGYGGSWSHLFY